MYKIPFSLFDKGAKLRLREKILNNEFRRMLKEKLERLSYSFYSAQWNYDNLVEKLNKL